MAEKNKKTKKSNKKNDLKRIRKISLRISAIIVSIILVCGLAFGIKFVSDIVGGLQFNQEKLYSNEPSPIFDKDNNVIYTLGSMTDGTRENVTYEDLPQVLVDAIVATEDSRFFEHNGIDLPRIVKAAIGNITSGGITSGGSTITQQLIKKSFYEDEYTNRWQRKIGEIFLARDAEKVVTKEEILVSYLNKIAFGRGLGTLGIQSGSRYYFDKNVQELTLPEAALLAGTLNSPDAFDPFYNLEKATKRRNVVLDLMFRHGYITKEEMEGVKAIPVENTLKKDSNHATNKYQNYIDLVNEELKEYKNSDKYTSIYPSLKDLDPSETPIEIHTFLDTSIQNYADDIASGKEFNFANEYVDIAASIQETTTGKVVGIIGGRTYFNDKTDINNAYEKHQPGSSLKPIIAYASAFEFLDWSTGHPTQDTPWVDPSTGHTVNNWNNQVTNKDMLLEVALANSFNLPAMHTMDDVINKVGINGMVEYLTKFGIDMSEEAFNAIYAIGGWKHGITPIEGAAAYATISNNGNYIKPHAIDYIIIKSTGEKIDIHNLMTPTRAISEESAFMITKVMQSYSKSMYSGMNIPYNVSAKSGTSDWGDTPPTGIPAGASKDSWLSAYTEDYAVSVWTGYNGDGVAKGYYPNGDIKKYSQRICGMLLKKAHNGTTKRSYSQPSGVVQTEMIKGIYPYVKPTADTPAENIVSAWFKTNNTPTDSNIVSGLNALSVFEVKATENDISVSFGTYDASGEDEKVTEIYGKPVYVVEVRDMITGEVLYTKTSETPSFTLDYKPTKSVQVVGYYSRDKSPSIKSNERTHNIAINNAESYTIQYYQDSLNGILLGSVKVDGSIDDKIDFNKIDLNKYKPENYSDGVIDKEKSAFKIVKGDKDIVYVIYKKAETSPDNNQNDN